MEMLKANPSKFPGQKPPIKMDEAAAGIIYKTIKQMDEQQRKLKNFDALSSIVVPWEEFKDFSPE